MASNLARWPRERNATAKSSPAFRSRVTLVGVLDSLMGVPSPVRRVCVTVGALVALACMVLAG
ncbi:hypothetical protein DSL05_22780, partial [Mycobacterium tuberculosis]